MAFTPRLTSAGMSSSATYYRYIYGTTTPVIPLPNCTFYAYSRTMEIAIAYNGGDWSNVQHYSNPYWYTGQSTYRDAEHWFSEAQASGLWSVGSTPKLGAIACWGGDILGRGGHVAIVEEINADGTVTLSNSDYGGSYFYVKYNQSLTVGQVTPYVGEKFLGYIYNPLTEGDTPSGGKKYLYYRRGDWVKIIKYGNSQANGRGTRAYGIGWVRRIKNVYPDKPYPYQVGLLGVHGTTGFYKQDALKKL